MRYYDIENRIQDLTHLQWEKSKATSGTGGCLLKSQEENQNHEIIYYKLSNYDYYHGIFGFESVNELIASRLMNVLGIEHVQYSLLHAKVKLDGKIYETWLCKSRNFRQSYEKKIPFETFYDLNRDEGESPFDFCKRFGFETQIQKMMLVDFLIINRDRHGANIEVLQSKLPNNSLRLAPLFDNGLSLFAPYELMEKRIADFDPLADVPANNFIGSKSLFDNLLLVTEPNVDELLDLYKEELVGGLENVLSAQHLDKIIETIWMRWEYYNDHIRSKK